MCFLRSGQTENDNPNIKRLDSHHRPTARFLSVMTCPSLKRKHAEDGFCTKVVSGRLTTERDSHRLCHDLLGKIAAL